MSSLSASYIAFGVTSALLAAVIVFAANFWRDRIGGEYGRDPFTTKVDEFHFNASGLPDDWLLNVNQHDITSVSEAAADGCVVDISKTENVNVPAADARRFVMEEAEKWQRSLTNNGYTFTRLRQQMVAVKTAHGEESWPTVEVEGRWIDDSLYFRQSNVLMLGPGYLLQIGRACQNSDLTPTEQIIDLVRFY